MQEKEIQDTITKLLLDSGACIKGKVEIMKELERFYQDLFAKDHIATPLQPKALQSLLQTITSILSSHKISMLE